MNGSFHETPGILNLLDKLYPVGSQYTTSKNVSPASYLGGTWTLSNKEFAVTYLSASTKAFVRNEETTSAGNAYVTLNGNCIRCRVGLTTSVALGNSSAVLGTIDFSVVGQSGLGFTYYMFGNTTDAECISQANVHYQTGALTHTGCVAGTQDGIIPAGTKIGYEFILPVRPNNMQDGFCDKFHWKRTA